ncbi:histidine kinase [Pelagivirga sediminicola]|uniref:Histidine kinase n=1 Tax=Pelagivirga sediminicola TaxID=2170575 RepID=A0A2T7G9I0_9RHOB|nr:alpha-hydroxy-acid oxidizing protein [Pelagivirga sediminicola]PVA11077.1 histidine kinase [Pelagivirga sediminicola]
MDESRRNFLGATALGLGTLPFVSPAAAQTTDAAAEAAANDAVKPSAYGASTAGKPLDIISLDRLDTAVQEVIPEAGYQFVSGAAGDEWTLRENRRAFDDFRIEPKRLRGVSSDVDLSIDLLGQTLPFPIFTAPMGAHGMVHEEAEVATARGTGMAGTLYCSSGASHRTLEEIAEATQGPKWFQLYWNNDIEVTKSLLKRAKDAGYSAIVLTADALGPGMPDDFKAMGAPFRQDMVFGNHDPERGGSGNFFDQKVDLDLDAIKFIKDQTGLPVVVKGLLRGDDADRCIGAGADAIQVSNHGGRQIDGVPASIAALPDVAHAVNGRVPVILDSGVRRGIDVIRALAMGANAVAVGRPVMYGLGLGGAQGVQSVLEHLGQDLRSAMLLTGAAKLSDLDPSYINLVGPSAEANRS